MREVLDRRGRILVLGMGGTIAWGPAGRDQLRNVADLLQPPPGVDVRGEDVCLVSGTDIDATHLAALCRRIRGAAASGECDAVIVTCGTDALEEVAWYTALTIIEPPVVITGAMIPAYEPDSDGPGNLRDAVLFAQHPAVREAGVAVILNGIVLDPLTVRKVRAVGRDAFTSLAPQRLGGHLATVSFRARDSALLGSSGGLAPVGIVDVRGGTLRASVVQAADGMAGLVMVGYGPGRIPQRLWESVRAVALRVPVVVTPGVEDLGQPGTSWPGLDEVRALGVVPMWTTAVKARIAVSLLVAEGWPRDKIDAALFSLARTLSDEGGDR